MPVSMSMILIVIVTMSMILIVIVTVSGVDGCHRSRIVVELSLLLLWLILLWILLEILLLLWSLQ